MVNHNINQEIWKDVLNYEGYYAVSNLGNVKAVKRKIPLNNGTQGTRVMMEKNIKKSLTPYGYLVVTLAKTGERNTRLVHRLVAQAFIPVVENKPFVNHKDEVKTNNHLSNLEWCDNEYNANYKNAQLSKKKRVKAVHVKTGETVLFESTMDAQREGFQQANISKVCNGERATHKGYKWEYID